MILPSNYRVDRRPLPATASSGACLPAVAFCIGTLVILTMPVPAHADEDPAWKVVIAQGIAERNAGNLNLSIDLLSSISQAPAPADVRAMAAGELGASLLQARRYADAESPLRTAYSSFSGSARARYALDLGNLALSRRRFDEARRYYGEGSALAAQDPVIQIGAELNLVRMVPEAERLPRLVAVAQKIDGVESSRVRARFRLNLGSQAAKLGPGALELAWRNLDQARTIAVQIADLRMQAEALDSTAQLYEDSGRSEDALKITQQGLAIAGQLESGRVADLRINLEWRHGRLFNGLGQEEPALAAYQRAVDGIEATRQDIPIENQDGKSSFRETLEPVYLGLADLLFKKASRQPANARTDLLYRIRDTVELIKQSELQDYLGDRCEVEAIHNGSQERVAPGVAVLYPIIFPDRTELLLETASGISWRSSIIKGNALRDVAVRFAGILRTSGNFLPQAQQLYGWLLGPFEDALSDQRIHTLVIVPDGALRLVPMSALHDGKRYAIEKFAIATVTGLTMTNSETPAPGAAASLVAGMSRPGPVVGKIPRTTVAQILDPGAAKAESSRGLGGSRNAAVLAEDPIPDTPGIAPARDSDKRTEELRESLALPGVKLEVQGLSRILSGTNLLDSDFTVARFQKEAESGAYRFVHIASHGVFGGTAEASYIMAYDDVLSMNVLQSLLKSERLRRQPLELLSLSACETAEGDDRSPLGISGVAIKARAKSVLGTLSPVEDGAARLIMESFYKALTAGGISKAQALQQAQIELMRRRKYSEPIFWAPFVLIGNWL